MNDAPAWNDAPPAGAGSGGGGYDGGYSNGGGRSPSPRRDRERDRSRSPPPPRGDGRGDDRGRAPQGASSNPGNNLHVSGLSSRVEERDLEDVFSKYGRIAKCSVVRDPQTKDSRGFAFVTMETGEEADAAIAALNATELLGRTLNVEKARRGRARTPTPGSYLGPPKRSDYGGGGGGGGGYRAYAPGGGYGRRGYDTSAMPMRDDPRDRRYDDRRRDDRYDDRDRRDYGRRDDYYSGGGGSSSRRDDYDRRDRR